MKTMSRDQSRESPSSTSLKCRVHLEFSRVEHGSKVHGEVIRPILA